MRHVYWAAMTLVAAFALSATDADASTVWLDGNIVASDTYEGDTVGSAPVADVGAWSTLGDFYFGRPLGVVTDAVSPAGPGAFSGSQYLNLGPDANRSLAVDLVLQPGSVVRFESMVYVTSDTLAFPWQVILVNGNSPALANRLLSFYRFANGEWKSDGVDGTFAGPASYAANAWQHWQLDYTVGEASATLAINGVSASIPASNTGLLAPNASLVFIQNQAPNAPTYLDDGTLSPAVPGDFDSDGDVDGADFVVWQTHFPTASGALLGDGDADGDGDVDGADFVVWQTNFPFTPGSGVTSVPEPTAIPMLLTGGFVELGRRALRRRRRLGQQKVSRRGNFYLALQQKGISS